MSTTEMLLHGVPVKVFDVATAAIGASVARALPARAGSIVWQTFFGTNPGAVQIDFEASLDGSHWDAIDSSTVVGGEVRTFATVGGVFFRINVVSITGGVGISVWVTAQNL